MNKIEDLKTSSSEEEGGRGEELGKADEGTEEACWVDGSSETTSIIQELDTKRYSITINLSPDFRILRSMQKIKYKWSEFSDTEQREYLALLANSLNCFDYTYELTKAGMVHLHGVLDDSRVLPDIYRSMFEQRLYKDIVKSEKRLKIAFYLRELPSFKDEVIWRKYMNKEVRV